MLSFKIFGKFEGIMTFHVSFLDLTKFCIKLSVLFEYTLQLHVLMLMFLTITKIN